MNQPKTILTGNVNFQRYDSAEAKRIRDTVERIYVNSYVDAISSGDPFDTVSAFMERFDAYTNRSDFDMVVAYTGNMPVGQTWGWPLDERAGKGWWSGLIGSPEPDFTQEDGHRTFALSEIMVRQEYTGKHIARALHNRLLSNRPEHRATLLVESNNEPAYRAYLNWGWRKVAQLRPNWPNAPLFDVLILKLPISTA